MNPLSFPALAVQADAFAARLAWRLRLPAADLDDLRQELLADLIRRLPLFNPERGSMAAFATVILRNQSSLMAARMTRAWSV